MTVFHPASYEQEIARIVSGVLATMCGDEAALVPHSPHPGSSCTASVGFAGQWKGALLVRCAASTARRIAERLMKTPNLLPEDVADTLGELANMIGGNLKPVLPPGVVLSVPCVALAEQAVRIPGRLESRSYWFGCEAGLFEVSLVRMLDET